jgi:hypothetical protein
LLQRQRRLRQVAGAGLAGFVGIVAAEHALTPSLDPGPHQISEYVHAPTGGLMVAALLVWAVSLAATAGVVWLAGRSAAVAGLLGLASVAILVTACFATQTSAGELPPGVHLTTTGRLHNLGSGVASVALLLGALAAIADGGRRGRRTTATLVAVAVLGSTVLLAVGRDVGGIRQRMVVAVACVWQSSLLRRRPPSRRS